MHLFGGHISSFLFFRWWGLLTRSLLQLIFNHRWLWLIYAKILLFGLVFFFGVLYLLVNFIKVNIILLLSRRRPSERPSRRLEYFLCPFLNHIRCFILCLRCRKFWLWNKLESNVTYFIARRWNILLAFIRHECGLNKTFFSTFNGSNIGFISEVQLTIVNHLLYVYLTS